MLKVINVSCLEEFASFEQRLPHKIILRRLRRLRDVARMDVDEPGELRRTGARLPLVNASRTDAARLSM